MTKQQFSEAMGEINLKFVEESIMYQEKRTTSVWLKSGVAACLCLLLGGKVLMYHGNDTKTPAPAPAQVQVVNPMLRVNSVEEMEEYLDFSVPVLEKEVSVYAVIVLNGYPTIGQIKYADDTTFRIQYGEGDISGISGGTLASSETVSGVSVDYYIFYDGEYAVWEKNGFVFSYVYGENSANEIKTLIERFA